jgi:hypothetical protein
MVDVQRRLARLEQLLARVRERRTLSRVRADATGNGRSDSAAPEVAVARPETLPPEAYDEVVDLSDEDIVELGDSVPPPSAQPARASEPPPVERMPSEAPVRFPSSIPVGDSGAEPVVASEPPVAFEPPVPPSPEPPNAHYGLDFDDEEEEPPASSRRPIASSMDEALADAAAREVPIKTPPPESGPQEAVAFPRSSPPAPAAASPDVDEALQGAAEANQSAGGLPTSAQLGNTIALEEGGPVEFDIEIPSESGVSESQPVPSEDFEIRLPPREAVGTYDSTLAPPPEARVELEAHRERTARAPVSEPAPAVVEASPESVEVTERPALRHGDVTTVTGAPPRYRPGSFLELLDASLKLGRG